LEQYCLIGVVGWWRCTSGRMWSYPVRPHRASNRVRRQYQRKQERDE